MRWFGNKDGEGHEAENPEVKPRNQILQTPESVTPKSKEKLQKSWELSSEKKNEINDGQKKSGEKYSKLDKPNTSSNEGDPSKSQRQLERGHETERE